MFGNGNVNEVFVKSSLVFSIITMLLMTSFIAVFYPSPATNSAYQNELDQLFGEYYDITGETVQNEQIWGLTGVYTPYGIDDEGNNSNAFITLNDGWVAGARITQYEPSQYKGADSLDGGKMSYTVQYNTSKKLYYYSDHGDDLLDITDGSTLYTNVTMDVQHQSNQFFTIGNKQKLENGTFYYNFTGYRYCFQSLSDYYYDKSTPITHTDTSLSLIWYNYTKDSGLSGQLVLTGSDSGLAYITARQITDAFSSTNYTAKFQMEFNSILMNIYIKINPYAVTHGLTIEECYSLGYWSILVTSPATSLDGGLAKTKPFEAFDPNKVFDITIRLLTWNTAEYGLTGIAGTIASTIFSMSMYTSLIAVGMVFWPVLLIAGLLATFQISSIADLWPW